MLRSWVAILMVDREQLPHPDPLPEGEGELGKLHKVKKRAATPKSVGWAPCAHAGLPLGGGLPTMREQTS